MLNNNDIGYTIVRGNNYKTKKYFDFIRKDILFYIIFLFIIVKSIIFIGLTSTASGSKLIIGAGFFETTVKSVYLLFTCLVLSFSFLFKNRTRLWFLIFINIIFTILLITDLMYFRAFGSFITLHLLKQTSNLENLRDSIISMINFIDIIFVIDIVANVWFAFKNQKIYLNVKRNFLAFIVFFILPIGLIYSIHYKVDILEKGQNKILFRTCWVPVQSMANLSPLGYHVYDLYNYYKDSKPYKLTKEDESNINSWYLKNLEDLPDNKYKGLLKGKNLLILQVESLENFVINNKINGQEITPNINKLLANSLYFSNFHEQVYNGTSSDSDLLTNTSVYPVRRGSTFFRYPNNTYNSLPNLLEKSGYSTLAIHSDKGSYWNWMPALSSIGFDKCIDSTTFNMDETIGLGLSDGSYFRQVIPLIKEQVQPFYTFMVTLSSHAPFDISNIYRELALPEYLDKTKLGGYFQSINYTDKQIGIFMSKLQEEGLLENTTVVLYGDHEGIHKFYNQEIASIAPFEDWWLKNNYEVPFIIYSKNIIGEEIETIGGQVDILPTISYIMGIDKNEYFKTTIGRNLLNTNKNFAILSNREIVGRLENDEMKSWALEGIDISDLIITSNYFNKDK